MYRKRINYINMDENENILTGYCFLAALTENNNDLYNQVYIPICKRALSLYSLQDKTHGGVEDIKKIIADEYGIDVPTFVVKKLINAVFKSLSSRAKKKYKFNVYKNGEIFEIEKYTFSDLEINYKKGQRNAKALNSAFEVYLKSEDINASEVPNFSAFLDKNKKHLASFFKNSECINGKFIETSFIHHVSFLEHIETCNHDLFEIAKGLYIGSIVAGFLESGIDLEPKFENNEVYYLDTPIILRAIDLQKEEETQPIIELLNIIKNTGGKVKVLSITINEIYNVITNAIANYNSSIPTSTINEACLRLKKNKAWLISYNGNLETNILKTLQIEKEDICESFIEENKNNPDVKALQERRIRKGNALHDVLSYLYVRKQRKISINSFQKAKAWFVSSNFELLKFNCEINHQNGISEIVMPDALTGLLWLREPKLIEKIKSVGLSELMAITLNEEIASKELINEFETTIKTIEGISQDDYRILLESVVYESAKKIEQFNEIAEKDKENAKVIANKIVEKERSRRAKNQKEIKQAQKVSENLEKQFQEKINNIEQQLIGTNVKLNSTHTEIEILSNELNRKNKSLKKYKRLLIGLISIFILIVVIIFWQKLGSIFGLILSILSGGGGIWGFGSLLINLIKMMKK